MPTPSDTHNILVRDFTEDEMKAVDKAWRGKKKSRQAWCKEAILRSARNGQRSGKH